jgi:allantoate deiminase
LFATVGEIAVLPGASNVIPGEVGLSLDVRHPADAIRARAVSAFKRKAIKISRRRKIKVTVETVHHAGAVSCNPRLSALLAKSVKQHQREVPALPSGAGHDAAALAAITPVAMLFVRCKGGISHHPEESVRPGDIKIAISVLGDFIQRLATEITR